MNEPDAFEDARRTFEKEQDFFQPEQNLAHKDKSKLSVLDEELLNLDTLHKVKSTVS